MPNRLEPLNLIDFTGGLNLRENQFQLRDNESPEMRNVAIDPLGGIYSRKGWERWNPVDIVDPDVTTWNPRRAFLHSLSDGTNNIYIASDNKIYRADNSVTFSDLGVSCGAVPHMADFVAWGDTLYIARGKSLPMARRLGSTSPVNLTPAGASTWNNDYSDPGASGTVAPKAELCEAHAGYLFVANIEVDGKSDANRVRWSHPTSPTDWAEHDFIDIDVGGSEITALMSFEDHLLIFKDDSVWALYGYDLDSWQLVQKSSTSGALSPQAVTRSEQAVFYASAADRGGVYAYTGERPAEISEQLRDAFQGLVVPELMWVGWLDRKLWVTLPWNYSGPAADSAAAFVFDPSVGERGAWTYYESTEGAIGPLIGGSNTSTEVHAMGVLRVTEHPCVVRLEALDTANDLVSTIAVLGFTGIDLPEGYITTGLGEEIIMSGMPGYAPFATKYRTPWVHAGWPTRKKSFRRPDFVCRDTGVNHRLHILSFRDYEELQAKRQYTLDVPSGGASAVWGHFNWNDGTKWGAGDKKGGMIRRGSSFGLCRAMQLVVEGNTPGARWGIDAIILKIVMRRFR